MAVLTPAGVYAPGRKPPKAEVIQLLEQIMGSSSAPAVVKLTKAALDLVTPASENYGGLVLNDPDPTKNGYYYRSSSTWVKGRGFPDTFAVLTSVAGTPNAITASAEAGVNPADIRLMLLEPTAANTGAVTLSVGGETPVALRDVNGDPLASGLLAAGRAVLVWHDGTYYRLASDPDADAAAAAAAASALVAQQAAADAQAGLGRPFDTKADAEAYDPATAPDFIQLAGYTAAGDCPTFTLKAVGGDPGHGASLQIAEGTWYEIVEYTRYDVRWFGARGDSTDGSDGTDDYAAIQGAVDLADGRPVLFSGPPGTVFRITQPITRLASATDSFRPGMRLVGASEGTSIQPGVTIALDKDNDAILKWDQDGVSLKYTSGSCVKHLRLMAAPGRTSVDGISATACWNFEVHFNEIVGVRHAIINPERLDIAANSDYYQGFAWDIRGNRIASNSGAGLHFLAGQSPGLWIAKLNIFSANAMGAVQCAQGQFEFTENLVVGNGTDGAYGGFTCTDVESASRQQLIQRNEFDTNFFHHLALSRVRNADISQNRFLSQTFTTSTGAVQQAGATFMRPAIHVRLGDGASDEVWNTLFARNYHRTVTSINGSHSVVAASKANPGVIRTSAPHGLSTGMQVKFASVGGMTELNGNTYTITVVDDDEFSIGVNTTGFTTYTSGGTATVLTTATVIAYANNGGTSTQIKHNKFENNDIKFRDGVTQNSTGMLPYTNISVTGDGNRIEEEGGYYVSAKASVATSVGTSATTVTFGTEIADPSSNFASGTTFTAPYDTIAQITASVSITGMTSGEQVTLAIWKNGSTVEAQASYFVRGSEEMFEIDADVALSRTDTITIRATHSVGGKNTVTTDGKTRLTIKPAR